MGTQKNHLTRRFFWAPKTYAKIMGKKIYTIYAEVYSLSKPVYVVETYHSLIYNFTFVKFVMNDCLSCT